MKKSLKFSLVLASLGLLVSCAPGSKAEKSKKEFAFPIEYVSDKPVVELDTLTVANVSDSAFKGIFSPQHYVDATDSAIIAYINEQLFDTNADFEAADVDTGMAKFHINSEKNTVEVTLREGLKWSDGHPLTVDDIIYTYEVIVHPDYTGVRYSDASHGQIIGAKEYHEGKASSISGLEKISDTRLDIHFKEVTSKMITMGGGLFASIMPRHYLKDIPMKDLESSDKIRKNPLSNGEYVINKIVPGESIEFIANEHYWKGKPKINKLIFKVIQTSVAIESMKQGEYFVYRDVPTDTYEKYSQLNNFTVIGRPALVYDYIAFNLGRFDAEKGTAVQDRDTPFQDVRLRKAIGHAIDRQLISDAFYNGLRVPGGSVTPPIFSKFYDETLENYFDYNPEKAKALLKEAGYEDTDGDKIVDKDGKPLVLQLAVRSGSEIAEPLAQEYKQKIEDIGIKVEFTTGRLMDFNLWVDKVLSNSNDIDAFVGAWSVGTSLDPTQTAARDARFNLYRFVDDENDKLLAALNDPKGLVDPNYRAEAYKAWQKHYITNLAVEIPLFYRYTVTPINKSMKQANLYTETEKARYFTEVVDTKPAVHQVK